MEDIHRPSNQRRNFASRHRAHRSAPRHPAAPVAPPPAPQPQPAAAAPAPYQSEEGFAPVAAGADDYQPYSRPVAQPQPRPAKKRLLPKVPVKYAAGLAAAAILVAAGAYMLTRPAQTAGFSVVQLSKKSTFGFYYPQPLPNGYTYDSKINAFQNGQAYFMLTNGSKHIVVHEQPAAGGLNAAGLSSPRAVQTPVGPANLGAQAGQPAAKVKAGSTLISLNSTGGVPSSDLLKVLDLLKSNR